MPDCRELRWPVLDGPYSVLLSADVYTRLARLPITGYPIREASERQLVDRIGPPAIGGAFVPGNHSSGDFDLQLGTVQSGTPAARTAPAGRR